MTSKPSILLIDDNPQVLETFSTLFEAQGIPVTRRASSAEEALAILEEESFSLIVSDYQLNGMDGVGFLETVRSRGDDTPVMLLSGAPDKQSVLKAIQQPKVDFFGKPFRIDDLLQGIRRLLSPGLPTAG